MVGLCLRAPIMQNGPSTLGINLLPVGLFVAFELFAFTVNNDMSTSTDSFGLKTVVSSTSLS